MRCCALGKTERTSRCFPGPRSSARHWPSRSSAVTGTESPCCCWRPCTTTSRPSSAWSTCTSCTSCPQYGPGGCNPAPNAPAKTNQTKIKTLFDNRKDSSSFNSIPFHSKATQRIQRRVSSVVNISKRHDKTGRIRGLLLSTHISKKKRKKRKKKEKRKKGKRKILSSCWCNRCGVDSWDELSHPSLSRLLNTNLGARVYLFAGSYLVSDNDVAANNSIAATSFLHLPATATAAPPTDQLRSPSSFFHPFPYQNLLSS